MITASKAIRELVPNASFVVKNDRGSLGYEIIKWDTDDKKPTDSEVQTKIAEMQSEYDTLEYARNRANEYPSNGDQWDMIYKDNLNSTTTHKDAVEIVKTKWPKNNSGPVE